MKKSVLKKILKVVMACFGCAGSTGEQCNEVMTRRYKI